MGHDDELRDVIGAPIVRTNGDDGVLLPEGVGFARVKPGKKGIARFQTTMPDYASFKKSCPLVPGDDQTGRPSRYDVLGKPYEKRGGMVEGEAEVGFDTVLAVDTMAAR